MIQELVKSKKFQEVTEAIKKKTSPIALSGLVDVEKAHTAIALYQELQKPICILTYNEIQAKKLCEDMKKFGAEEEYVRKGTYSTK